MKKLNNKKIIIGIVLVVLVLIFGKYFGFFTIASECGSFSGTGSVYYYSNVDGNCLDSSGQPCEQEDIRFTSRDLESVVEQMDNFYATINWNPAPGIEWAKCTVGSYTPHRCGNPWSRCSGVPISEIEAVREDLIQNSLISIFRLENNNCRSVSIPLKDRLETDFTTLEECEEFIKETFYRFQDNKCESVLILSDDKTTNDYTTLLDCQENILRPITIYRIENNVCNNYTINERDKTDLEFESISLCQVNLIKEQTYFRLSDNECTEILIFPYDSTETDFASLELCEEKISKWYQEKIYWIVIGLIILLILGGLFYKKRTK